jgi:hypothetical protein
MFGHSLVTFNPKNIPGIRLWLDAANVFNGSNPANNTALSSWSDLSGVSGNATQATSGKRPVFRENIQNGLPAIEFDSANSQCLQVASLAVGSQITIFVVVEQFIATAATWFMEQSPDVNTNDGFYMYGNGLAGQIKNFGNNVMTQNIAGWLGADAALGMIRYDGATIEPWLNGTLYPAGSGTGTISNFGVANVLNIGSRNQASLFFDGYLYEVIIYNGALSNLQVTLVNDYLRRKWAIY